MDLKDLSFSEVGGCVAIDVVSQGHSPAIGRPRG